MQVVKCQRLHISISTSKRCRIVSGYEVSGMHPCPSGIGRNLQDRVSGGVLVLVLRLFSAQYFPLRSRKEKLLGNLDWLDIFARSRGRNALINPPKQNQMGCDDPEEKKAAIRGQISRITKLPSNSSYTTHRLRVMNKVLSLLTLQRTTSQEEELELLFAGLAM